jgi:7-alpha-hydroxysteroid dehydrogenase
VDDIAAAAVWLASPAAGFVTGKVIAVDGGAQAPTLPSEIPDL